MLTRTNKTCQGKNPTKTCCLFKRASKIGLGNLSAGWCVMRFSVSKSYGLSVWVIITFGVCLQGFSVEGQENIQEILSKQLYLCQFLGALSILRKGTNCVFYFPLNVSDFSQK